jgi:DAACS family dicarboxylate/amino acid:cation (Na+ or H+) symporter
MLAGVSFGERVVPLGGVGSAYIHLIKVVAVPLVFLSILEAIVATALSWRTASRWLLVIAINTSCALLIGLALSNFFKPGVGFKVGELAVSAPDQTITKSFSAQSFFDSLIPKSFVAPFIDNNVLGVVVLAVLLGVAMRVYCAESREPSQVEAVQTTLKFLNGVVTRLVFWLVKVVPLAVFCVTARTVGESGFEPFVGLLKYVGVAGLGLLMQVMLVYPWWIVGIGRIPLRVFWTAALRPAAYAFGTNSSLATIPVTLHALDELKIPKSASRLATCIGTNFNNDGILLYEAVAVLFVAQVFGIELSLGEQLFAASLALMAAIGVAGVPEAGVVSLSLVLSAVGLPLEILPLLLTVDWIVARMRSVVNVMSDMTVSIAVDSLERG